MALRYDLALPSHDTMRVPMDLLRIQSALRERDIHLGPSLWALTGSAPPGADRWASLAEQDDVRELPVAQAFLDPVLVVVTVRLGPRGAAQPVLTAVSTARV